MYVYVYIANVCVYEMGYEDAENKQAVLICSRTLFFVENDSHLAQAIDFQRRKHLVICLLHSHEKPYMRNAFIPQTIPQTSRTVSLDEKVDRPIQGPWSRAHIHYG